MREFIQNLLAIPEADSLQMRRFYATPVTRLL
jgi:hypothetical protein